ncbi:MAG TPA: hypothetical protein VMB24_06295 [Dehalococcoidales bacterium]|nr:hypothetical protein [Dehalococcoidales bacterium]
MKILRMSVLISLALAGLLLVAGPALAADALPFLTNLEITDGQTSQIIGEVTVSSSGSVIFQIDEANTPWRLEKTELYIGDTSPDKVKTDKYNFQHDGLGGASSDWYDIDLASFDANGDGVVYISAYAELTQLTALSIKHGKQPGNTDSAWARGDQSSGKGKNFKSYFSVYWWNIG